MTKVTGVRPLNVKSLVVYNSIADCEHIHGHGGRTTVRWLDPQ